ncbi:MAG: DUF4326 domain-containing protein [Dehalococcoidia bacterium]
MPAAWGVERFRAWLSGEYSECGFETRRQWILEHLTELRGLDLACWCVDWDGTGEAPNVCHAEVLLELANPATRGPGAGPDA